MPNNTLILRQPQVCMPNGKGRLGNQSIELVSDQVVSNADQELDGRDLTLLPRAINPN